MHRAERAQLDIAYSVGYLCRAMSRPTPLTMLARHFFVRELVEEGTLRVSFVGTADNWADFFTKPLQGQHFFRMRAVIMNEAPPATGGRRG